MESTKIKLDTIKVKNSKGEIWTLVKTYDNCPENPREYFERISTFYTFENRHNSPDKHSYRSVNEWADANGFIVGNSPNDLIDSMTKKGYIALPVWRYEHSSVSYSAAMTNPYNCRWDSGMVGIIYISKKDVRKYLSVKKVTTKVESEMIDILQSEVKEYSSYSNGDVYSYELYDSNDELVDSVSGIYDSDFDDIFNYFYDISPIKSK